MNNKDLRIGSLINYNGCLVEVSILADTVFFSKDSNFSKNYDEAEGIPITEEWLLKFDFTHHHNDYFNNTLLIKNVIDFETGEPNTDFDFLIYPNETGSAVKPAKSKKIKYVHDLQNIYHSITGQELTADFLAEKV
jgi:hypothetical protein